MNRTASPSAFNQFSALCYLGINFLPITWSFPGVFQCSFSPSWIRLRAVLSTQAGPCPGLCSWQGRPWVMLSVPEPPASPRDSAPPGCGCFEGCPQLVRERSGIPLPQTRLLEGFICTGRSRDLLLFVHRGATAAPL